MMRIVDWQKNFENNRSREIKKLDWVPFPNKHDGDGYTELLEHENGVAHYGAWCAIVQVASKCDPRGTLVRDGGKPHTAATLARMTRIPERILLDAIERLVEQIGWIELLPEVCISKQLTSTPHDGAALSPQDDATAPQEGALNGREENGMEGNEGNGTEEKFSLSLADGLFELPPKWQVSSLVLALKDWVGHLRAQNKPFGAPHLESLLYHHASAGWTADRLERGIRLSLSKSTASTIIDPDGPGQSRPTRLPLLTKQSPSKYEVGVN